MAGIDLPGFGVVGEWLRLKLRGRMRLGADGKLIEWTNVG